MAWVFLCSRASNKSPNLTWLVGLLIGLTFGWFRQNRLWSLKQWAPRWWVWVEVRFRRWASVLVKELRRLSVLGFG